VALDQSLTRSPRTRDRFDHPVIDFDGHMLVEFLEDFEEYLREEGVDTSGEVLVPGGRSWGSLTEDERVRLRATRLSWWPYPTRRTADLAATLLPKLLYERLDDIGIDLAIVYPSVGLGFLEIGAEDLRRACCRAYNRFVADLFRPFSDRLLPVALVPAHTPGEAVEALRDARGLGLKPVAIPAYVRRPGATEGTFWLDTYGIDSVYDYDPLWSVACELGVALSMHSSSMGVGTRTSISSYMYNHMGHFAASSEAAAKSLVLGGVMHRFPDLRVAFLEGGVAWAVQLLCDIAGHWEKRNPRSIGIYDPTAVDVDAFARIVAEAGCPAPRRGTISKVHVSNRPGDRLDVGISERLRGEKGNAAPQPDEWARSGIDSPEDLRRLFVEPFVFGCEADDRLVAIASDPRLNPVGERLGAVFSSDSGHWDVPDIGQVLTEAYEGVDRGVLSEDDFRRFVFETSYRFYAGDPGFFTGTVLEGYGERAGAIGAAR
jgi:predicted TIM-barrel fold metal-dependent hydrolase